MHSANVTIAHLFSATTNTPRTLAAHIKSESSPASEADYLLDGQSEDDEAGNNTFRRNVGQERWWHRCCRALFACCMAAVSRVPRTAPVTPLVGEPCNDGIPVWHSSAVYGPCLFTFLQSCVLLCELVVAAGVIAVTFWCVLSSNWLMSVLDNMNEMLLIVLAFSTLLLLSALVFAIPLPLFVIAMSRVLSRCGGEIKPGRYPKWSSTHMRIWYIWRMQRPLVYAVVRMQVHWLASTLFRCLGASVGEGVSWDHESELLPIFAGGQTEGASVHRHRRRRGHRTERYPGNRAVLIALHNSRPDPY